MRDFLETPSPFYTVYLFCPFYINIGTKYGTIKSTLFLITLQVYDLFGYFVILTLALPVGMERQRNSHLSECRCYAGTYYTKFCYQPR
jgi:hypothetical protein